MKDRTGYRKESLRRLIYKRWFSITMLGGIIAVVLIGSLFVLLFERHHNPEIQTYGDALWLSFVTMATVGYGDKVPITPGGKVTTIMSMVLGITLLTGFITARAAIRVDKAKRRANGLERMTSLRDHIVVSGWNQRGKHVLGRLADASKASRVPVVLLCDLDSSPLEDDFVFFYKGSPVVAEDQKRAGVPQASSMILLADELVGGKPADVDARTVLAALTARALNPDIKMTAEALEPENVQHLQRAGVEEVLDHNLVVGNLLAQSVLRFGIIEVVTALAQKETGAKVYRLPANREMAGKTCGQVFQELEQKGNYTLVGVRGSQGLRICDADSTVLEDDVLLVLAPEPPPGAEETS
jgi:voltage-gated potassium channel